MKTLSELLSSKKFIASLLATLGAIAIKFGVPETTVTEMTTILSPLLVYIGAQGMSDAFGKGKVQAELELEDVEAAE